MKMIQFGLCLGLLLTFCVSGIAQDKIVITKADDLPRRSVTLYGKATQIVEDRPQLDSLVDAYTARLEADLAKYDIQDKSTLKEYYLLLTGNYAYRKDFERALALIERVRELEDKESEKLTTGLFLSAFAEAYRRYPEIDSEPFRQRFAATYRELWEALPYAKVADALESQRGSLSIFNPALVTSGLDSQLQPFLDNNNNVVPEGIVSSLVGIRLTLDYRAALIPSMLDVLNERYEANRGTVAKTDIWAARDVALTPDQQGTPVVVAIWDSGTDVGVFPPEQLHRDAKGRHGIGYSLIDYKKDGLLLEDPAGKIRSDLDRLQRLTKGFMDLQAAVESPEVQEIRQTIAGLQPEAVKDFQEELSFYGNYAHGTHVAGIALEGNPFARLLVVRMGFDYRTLPPAHTLGNAKFQAKMYGQIVDHLKRNNVRVVNMSWRYGVASYEGLLALHGVGKDEADRKRLARQMFELEKEALSAAIASAPEILFICASGNENNDAAFAEYLPASLELPNLITIGAVDSEGKKTSFTTEGKNVRLYANGFEVESFVPGGDRVKFSGTSMASPNVANLAAKLLALRPQLSPAEVIAWIEKGADSLPENPELRLIHPRKTLEGVPGVALPQPAIGRLLLRKWSPDAATAAQMVEDYLAEVRAQSPEQADAMAAQKEMLAQVFTQLTIEYKADGTVEVAAPSSPVQTGTWQLREADRAIVLEMAGQAEVETIQSLSDSELVTTTSEGHTYTYVAVGGR